MIKVFGQGDAWAFIFYSFKHLLGTTPAKVFVLDTSHQCCRKRESMGAWGSGDYDEGLELTGKQGISSWTWVNRRG